MDKNNYEHLCCTDAISAGIEVMGETEEKDKAEPK
jgi:hypothetical protein